MVTRYKNLKYKYIVKLCSFTIKKPFPRENWPILMEEVVSSYKIIVFLIYLINIY